MKILLVDDDRLALKVLSRQLATLGFSDVTTHERARDALAWLGQPDTAPVDLIVADLQMPDMDGVEFLRHLGTMAYPGELVISSSEDSRILLAAHNLAQAHGLRVLGTLAKPATLEPLRALLARRGARPGSTPDDSPGGIQVDELQRAVDERELVNYYEPQVEIATGAVTGVEALVRWHHPARGLVYPSDFIALAESHDLIRPLTRHVMTEALHQAGRWQRAGTPLRVSVNISMALLDSLWLPDHVAQEADKAGVAPSCLVLELTESGLTKDMRMPLDILARLRLKRVGLSIDDFGTGHSSLAQLRDLPFSELKIDRPFVHGAGADRNRRAVFDASFAMARGLGLTVVAEGVEDRADWDFVRAAGCDTAQGYFTGRAMPASALPAWMANWKTRHAGLASG